MDSNNRNHENNRSSRDKKRRGFSQSDGSGRSDQGGRSQGRQDQGRSQIGSGRSQGRPDQDRSQSGSGRSQGRPDQDRSQSGSRRFHGGSRRSQGSSQGRGQVRLQKTDLHEAGPPDRLEGRNPIKEALRAGRNINKVWIKRRDSGRYDQDLTRLVQDAKKAGAVIVEVDGDVLDSMATSYGHQGIIAQIAAHEYVTLPELIARGEEQMAENTYPLLILLDGLEESYNLGSILRIADAAGATGIIIPERRSVALDATVAKASAGAIEYVPVARVTNLSNTIQTLKDSGYWVYGADAQGTATPEGSDWLRKIALVIGSEGKGMSAKIVEACDHLVSIPQYGRVNSLNAAVACGILVFEAKRQARHNNEGDKPSFAPSSEVLISDEDLHSESAEV